MNRERDFDQTLMRWLDDGTDQAPERYVWAALSDVERTAQRGAWLASLKGSLMKPKAVTMVLSAVAVVLLAIVAYEILGSSRFAGPTEPSSTPRLIVVGDLSRILPPTEVDLNTGSPLPPVTGNQALRVLLPEGTDGFPRTGFIDARVTNHSGEGGYQTWSALFDTAADAQGGFDFLTTTLDVESTQGWSLGRSGEIPGLGDESMSYSGSAPFAGLRHVGVYLWRVNNVLLAVFQFNYNGGALDAIASEMDARAH
jgi:hypothetical protein